MNFTMPKLRQMCYRTFYFCLIKFIETNEYSQTVNRQLIFESCKSDFYKCGLPYIHMMQFYVIIKYFLNNQKSMNFCCSSLNVWVALILGQ